MSYRKSRHYIFGAGSGSGGERKGEVEVVGAHAFCQDDAEAIEEDRLRSVGLGDAAQADLAMRGRGQDDVVRLDAGEFFKHGARRVAQAPLKSLTPV